MVGGWVIVQMQWVRGRVAVQTQLGLVWVLLFRTQNGFGSFRVRTQNGFGCGSFPIYTQEDWGMDLWPDPMGLGHRQDPFPLGPALDPSALGPHSGPFPLGPNVGIQSG